MSGTKVDVKNILSPYFADLTHEEFFCIFLNRANKVIKMIVAHNHPSGNLNPSESDVKITRKIKEAGNSLNIQLLDHLIIYDSDYYSFADNGVL